MPNAVALSTTVAPSHNPTNADHAIPVNTANTQAPSNHADAPSVAEAGSSPEARFPSRFDPQAPVRGFEQRAYNNELGQAIASDAAREARSRQTVGWCYNAVADTIDRQTEPFLRGSHAYQSADQLASRTDLFREAPATNLDKLPAGAVVVWGKGTSRSGHISIALGDGREASDHIAPQMMRHYGGAPARVFLPVR